MPQTWQVCFPLFWKAKLCHLLPVSYIRALSLSRQGDRVNTVEAQMDSNLGKGALGI